MADLMAVEPVVSNVMRVMYMEAISPSVVTFASPKSILVPGM